MKKTDEIKKGLECCANDAILCSEKCPYYNPLSNGVDCAGKMHTDVLALIQQLEAELAAVKRQRDALLWDMQIAAIKTLCHICKRHNLDDCFKWRGLCKKNGGVEE